MSTSVSTSNRSSKSTPVAWSRSNVTPRLLVLNAKNRVEPSGSGTPSMKGGSRRAGSPHAGGYTLIVLAPWSANNMAQKAPDRLWDSSTTLMSEKMSIQSELPVALE